jgi:23S rRNA pseudouridine1911/1915/1917 synthase
VVDSRFQRDLSSPIEERCFEVGAPDHGARLDAFLARRMAWRSRSRVQELIAAGRVTLEQGGEELERRSVAPPRASARLRAGAVVTVALDSAFVDAGEPAVDSPELEILHDDRWLLAVSKPAPMNLYPTRRHLAGSLTERVHRRHRALGLEGSPPSPCHRLDRETSGLVLFARDRDTRADLGRQFEVRSVEKTYLALVAGQPRDDEGVIDLPLGRDLSSRVEIKQGPRLDGGGLPSLTRWRVRERRGSACTLLELHPATGRQHQLRAHLAAIGHPILGDKLYLGGDDLFLASLDRELHSEELRAVGGAERLALHAWRIAFLHPATGERVTLEAPPPEPWWCIP